MSVLTILRDAMIVAAGGAVVAGIVFIGKQVHKGIRARHIRKLTLEAERDATLQRVVTILGEVKHDQKVMGEDIRCLYPIQLAQLESLEISLMAIHGEGLNGNVGDAIEMVRKTKKEITTRLIEKMGCQDIGKTA